MKLELKENMYIRTKDGYIDKILKLNESYVKGVSQKDDFYAYDIDNIVKASYNIIDLIEVGDYVNGSKVYYCYCADEDSTGLFIDTEKGRQWLDNPSQVKSIVTKEQFESMEYKVGD